MCFGAGSTRQHYYHEEVIPTRKHYGHHHHSHGHHHHHHHSHSRSPRASYTSVTRRTYDPHPQGDIVYERTSRTRY
ncbi:hypothetical protein VDGD_21247 [Verticillium dahliae]|nr:hypothetical protein VDGD_21247 [Verticillium dahliae]